MGKCKENPCNGVFIPSVDERPVACKEYVSTDCSYVSDKVNFAPYQLQFNDSLTNLLNCILNDLKELNKEVSLLKRDINKSK